MRKLITTGTLGLAALVTAGLVAWQVPVAAAHDGSSGSGGSGHSGHSGKAFKREDDSHVVVTTVDDDDDDDTGLKRQHTRTRTNTSTGTRTRGRHTDHSRARAVRDLTNDGPGRNNVDRSRHHTNDGTRHNTRGR